MVYVSLLLFADSHCSAGVLGSAPLLTALLAALSSDTKTSHTSTVDTCLNNCSFPLHLQGCRLQHGSPTLLSYFLNIQIVYSFPLLGFEGFLSENAPNFQATDMQIS